MINEEIRTLAAVEASRCSLPLRLVMAIVQVESGGDTTAIRFEPDFFDRYIRNNSAVKAKAPCSLDTERQARAFSWGLMQVMGETARGLGFTGPFLSALTDPATGLHWGCECLRRIRDRSVKAYGWPGVVAMYNAGSVRFATGGKFINQGYVDAVLQACGGVWPPKE